MEKKLKQKISQTLGISEATVENWYKSGLIPAENEKVMADEAAFANYIKQIQNNTKNKLKTRANRTSSKEKFVVLQGQKSKARKELLEQLIKIGQNQNIEAAVVGAAVRQLECCKMLESGSRIERDCRAWVKDAAQKSGLTEQNILHMFDGVAISAQNDDILGSFYQSLQNIGQKAGGGSFYTPVQALTGISIQSGQTVYDPCCGSGNILLNILEKTHNSELIYASDIDETALIICETNLVLFFEDPNMKATIYKKSFLEPADNAHYDVIVTNPPWGAHFSTVEKKELKNKYPELQTSESFSICLYNALKLLQPGGQLYFFLPQSFTNVAAHSNIRQHLLHRPGLLSIRPLGPVFSGVFSKCILLHFTAGVGRASLKSSCECSLSPNLHIEQPGFVLNFETTEKEQEIIEKVYAFPHLQLRNNAKFFLGIVTGSNDKFISTESAHFQNAELIYRGKNILPYRLAQPVPAEFISFCPEKFQQCAKPELYRQRKIVYRFIYDRPVCAICENGELMLNSANCFIPTLDYPWETIVALFNSDLYAMIYKKKFNSLKVLRHQLEDLPLPLFTPEQHAQIKKLYEQIKKSAPDEEALSKKLNELISAYILN